MFIVEHYLICPPITEPVGCGTGNGNGCGVLPCGVVGCPGAIVGGKFPWTSGVGLAVGCGVGCCGGITGEQTGT